MEQYDLNGITEWNFQTVGPSSYVGDGFIFEPWQGRKYVDVTDSGATSMDGRFKLGTYTVQNRSFWELNTYDEKAFSSYLSGNESISDEARSVITSSLYPEYLGDENQIVVSKEEPPSFSVDTFVYKMSDEKTYPLFIYYDKDLHKEEYQATTEGKVSLKIVTRDSGRDNVHFNPFMLRRTIGQAPQEFIPNITYNISNHNFNLDTDVSTGNVRLQWATIPSQAFTYMIEGDELIYDWNLETPIVYKLYVGEAQEFIPITYEHIGNTENTFFDFNPNTYADYQNGTTYQFRINATVPNPNGGTLETNFGQTFGGGVTTTQNNFDFPIGSVSVAIDSNNTNLIDRLNFLYYDGATEQWNLTEVNEDSFKLLVSADSAYPSSSYQTGSFIAASDTGTGNFDFQNWELESNPNDAVYLMDVDLEANDYPESFFPSQFNYLNNIRFVGRSDDFNGSSTDLTSVRIKANYQATTGGNAPPVNVDIEVSGTGGGSVSPSGVTMNSDNQTVQLQAFPESGKRFVKWEISQDNLYVGFGSPTNLQEESQVREAVLVWNGDYPQNQNSNYALIVARFASEESDPPGTCFLEGTLITMADGTTKPIEKIEVGDLVMSYDEDTKTIVGNKVVETMFHTANPQHLSYGKYLIINNTMRVTLNHPIFADTHGRSSHDWPTAETLRVDDYLYDKDLNKVRIHTIEPVDAIVDTYNFEVENAHTYIAENYIVHNIGGEGSGKGGGRVEVISAGTAMESQDLGGSN